MKKKGTAYQKMLLSFIVVFCLPLCMVVLFYFYSGNVMEKQMELSNMNLLQTVRNVCDQEIQFYQNILRKYSADSFVKELGMMDEMDSSKYSEIESLGDSLADSAVSIERFGGVGKELFLYFPKIGRIYSVEFGGLQMFSTYQSIVFGENAELIDPLLDQLSVRADFASAALKHGHYGENMLLLTRSCWSRIEDCRATVGVWLDTDILSGRIAAIDWEYGFDWLIVDGNGCVLKGMDGMINTGAAFDASQYSGMDDYFVTSIASEVMDWQYVLMIPRNIIQDSVGRIRVFFFISLAICVLLGYFLMRKITVMNYAPLQSLMDAFQNKRESGQKKKDEYQFLQEQISTLITSRTDMEKKISRSGDAMKKWALVNLLVKPFVRQANGEEDAYFRAFDNGRNMVLLVKEKSRDTDDVHCEENDDMKMFIIDNVFNEKVGEAFTCRMVELDGHQVLIVHDPKLDAREEKLWEIIYDLQQIVLDYFDLSVTVSGGGIHDNLEGIHESYLEAREAEEFIPILEQDCIDYDDIRDNTRRKYDYSMQAEERIISAIQNNNVELAIAFIDKILELNFTENRTSSNMRRCLLNDIYCTLLKAADEKDCIDQIDISQHSFGIEMPLEEIREKYARLVRRICVSKEKSAEYSTDKELCQRVLAYVRENFENRDLNISQTAQHFHMSPSNLSAIYKRETGKSLLKVINEVRIENAVEYLRKGYSVVETAEKVGISESSSFIRLFKKHMGVTPGQLKAHLLDEDDEKIN